MIVGVLRLELLLYSPQSLKEKRSLVKKLLARLRQRFQASIAEVELHESWQRACIGVVMVAAEAGAIERLPDLIEDEITRSGLAELGPREFEILHY